ncbi:hydroxymethylbilane synthase [Lacihabitans sp. LS3-19]|uniref:hydroxymethylbilane synthase n=1 Tax=Lacihabitans sp. LS3-19 TaxID=2487335 RepID=UPI0020CD9AE5|nr:hydroxymethylbilane synthase [Lacihabitans sp. LS3-19]MCP9769119.1 hydroxymethylbilane synthase [Lacihabitans sp. LS3-19]
MNIKIGTRGSLLALWQAEYIKAKLEAGGLTTEIIIIETKGDKILDRALSKIGSKGVFTEELEEQLHIGAIDIAVHSAKDLQSELHKSLSIIAFTEREKTNDVLVSNKDIDVDTEITIGTSSTRRVAMLKSYFPHFKIVDMRGNLQTRIRKMEEGQCDALLLAYAGVNRMKYNELIRYEFDNKTFVPPVGQGTVAIEISNNLDKNKADVVRTLCNDLETEQCLLTERAYLKELKGGCSIPVFGNAKLLEDKIHFTAGIISLDGKEIVKTTEIQNNESPAELGIKIANIILANGGKEILEKIKAQL